jgi:hypothetical protein
MATPTTSSQLNLGNRMGVVAAFSSLSNGNTWATGLASIEHVSITNGASGQTVGYTVSGGTVTFAASGALSNVTALAIGFA